jgi:hypothetical protein
LHTVFSINNIFKYADYTTSLVSGKTDAQLEQEFQKILLLGAHSHLIINQLKTKELDFIHPWVKHFHFQAANDHLLSK